MFSKCFIEQEKVKRGKIKKEKKENMHRQFRKKMEGRKRQESYFTPSGPHRHLQG